MKQLASLHQARAAGQEGVCAAHHSQGRAACRGENLQHGFNCSRQLRKST